MGAFTYDSIMGAFTYDSKSGNIFISNTKKFTQHIEMDQLGQMF